MYLFYVTLIHVVIQISVYNLTQNYIRVRNYVQQLWQTERYEGVLDRDSRYRFCVKSESCARLRNEKSCPFFF
jgi:hypothetical protein